jgi:Cdc6-like AAA superfamily ATPase
LCLAGTGKTFLTSKVIDEIQLLALDQPEEGFAFFYCNRNETNRRQPLSVLRAFIRQLSNTTAAPCAIRKELRDYYVETRRVASEPTMGTCKDLLIKIIKSNSQTTLVLDALDECENADRVTLIDAMEYLLEHTAPGILKIFISGRPEGELIWKLKSRTNIRIDALHNDNDISTFVNGEIVKHKRWSKISPDLQELVVKTLQERSQGM